MCCCCSALRVSKYKNKKYTQTHTQVSSMTLLLGIFVINKII